MNDAMNQGRGPVLGLARIAGWGTIVTLILLPVMAMQFTNEVRWTMADFAFAAAILGGVGLAFEMALRVNGHWAYRGGAAIALIAGLLLLWANAAVGIVGNERETINLWFDLIPLLTLFAAIGARFRSEGMAVAMLATAISQVLVAIIVQLSGHFTWAFTAVWTSAWLLSAWLFRKSGRSGR